MRPVRAALRPRLLLDLLALAVVLVAAVLVVRSLVGSSEHHTDHAIELVPQGTLLYVHLDVDRSSGQWRSAQEILRKLPLLARFRDQALAPLASGKSTTELDAQVKPWLGDEAALALLPQGAQATSLVLLRVRDEARAKSFLAGAGPATFESYKGTLVRRYKTLAAAFLGDFLVIGRLPHVRAAIDAKAGVSLAEVGDFRAAVKPLELDGPLVYAYAPEIGVRRLLERQPGLVGRLGALLARPRLRGAAAAVRFRGDGLRVALSNALIPTLPGADTSTSTGFRPQLPGTVPRSAIAYFGTRGLTSLFQRLQAFAGGPASLSGQLAQIRRALGPEGERALARAVQPLENREVALIVTPPDPSPIVTLVVADTTQAEGGDILIALQPLLSRVAGKISGGQATSLEPGTIAGIETLTLTLNPTLSLTYAALGDRIAVSTSPEGIRQLVNLKQSLIGNDRFAPGMRGFLKQPTSVVFSDLHRLSALVERAGLGATPEYRALKPELSKLGTVSVITASERSSETTQVFVEVP